jgi:L-ribulokinase
MPAMPRRLSLGLDFGTESGRALLVDVASGEEVASAVHRYADGVIDERLPGTSIELEPEWALQNPDDWIEVLRHAVPEAMRIAGAAPEEVIGIGIDFTACTVLPTLERGTPLCVLAPWRETPHAWPKLWKHHAAHPEAERITALAAERAEPWLAEVGGRVSSEWMHSKALEILLDAPEVYDAAERIIEGGDWIVWQLTGVESRNATAAGYKALWSKERGYPSPAFLSALDPRMAGFHTEKTPAPVVAPGHRVGVLLDEAAEWMGLRAGIPVSAATIDAHASVPGAGVTGPGAMVLILGTSTCHMLMDRRVHHVPGISGVVEDGIVPGLVGYEAGQAGVGDIFEWFVEHGAPAEAARRAEQEGMTLYELLEREAAELAPGESGLLALDWWNGNRSVLTDASLNGVIVGMTLGTRAHQIYRALIEATAFGTRIIIDTFERNGVAVTELVACGGLAERNRLLLQIYADVTGREFRVARSGLTSALGAAMNGAVAAGNAGGGYDDIATAARAMGRFADDVYHPIAEHRRIFDQLFGEYVRLHDYFGRGGNDVMRVLRETARAIVAMKSPTS